MTNLSTYSTSCHQLSLLYVQCELSHLDFKTVWEAGYIIPLCKMRKQAQRSSIILSMTTELDWMQGWILDSKAYGGFPYMISTLDEHLQFSKMTSEDMTPRAFHLPGHQSLWSDNLGVNTTFYYKWQQNGLLLASSSLSQITIWVLKKLRNFFLF
jgi:hypothetical protein